MLCKNITGEARVIFLLRRREANVHESSPDGEAHSRGNILLRKTLQGLVMVSTGIMKLEKRVARDASNSTIKIKR